MRPMFAVSKRLDDVLNAPAAGSACLISQIRSGSS